MSGRLVTAGLAPPAAEAYDANVRSTKPTVRLDSASPVELHVLATIIEQVS
jgi:hypothetical protein